MVVVLVIMLCDVLERKRWVALVEVDYLKNSKEIVKEWRMKVGVGTGLLITVVGFDFELIGLVAVAVTAGVGFETLEIERVAKEGEGNEIEDDQFCIEEIGKEKVGWQKIGEKGKKEMGFGENGKEKVEGEETGGGRRKLRSGGLRGSKRAG